MKFLKQFLFVLLCITSLSAIAQDAVIYGTITDNNGKKIEFVNVGIIGVPSGTATDKQGYYKIAVVPDKPCSIQASFIGFKTVKINVSPIAPGDRKEINIKLVQIATELPTAVVESDKDIKGNNYQKINPKLISVIPNAGGNGVEALIKTMPGVSSNNELSSQYSVRGGNYDENLVYVNDVEIYRPFLVRSGQQEGLSFINSDLVSNISFSAGGFEAKYGDKLSSVLDITYKRPIETEGAVSMSLLGGSAYLGGLTAKGKLSYNIGVRQKSNQYLLNSMETSGNYKPSFTDFQSVFIYDINSKWDLSLISAYSRNTYRVIPETRETSFGTMNDALRLKIYFDGQEMDRFETFTSALTSTYEKNKNLRFKFIASAFNSSESETFDIQGQYWLDQLEIDMNSDNFGDKAMNLGVGTYLNHARNYLSATVANLEQKGYYSYKNNLLQWGVKYQREIVHDKLNEWNMLDSSDFTLPHYADVVGYADASLRPFSPLNMLEVVHKTNDISSNRYSAYVQNSFGFNVDSTKMTLVAGVRSQYWDLNQQVLISPRLVFTIKPNWKRNMQFRLSTGKYSQSPFYRELRDFKGDLNTAVKAQESIHFLTGMDYNFRIWRRPFKLVAETYYKILNNLVPYEVDNVRIRYYAKNNANGYAYGFDMKLNGEFVKSIESWASMSVMKTEEDITDDYYYKYFWTNPNTKEREKFVPGYSQGTPTDSVRVEPGYVARPTDQRVNFSLFFQDYLPMDSTFKMHMTLVYGTRLPVGAPNFNRYGDTLRIPPYRRVDIGFSKQLKGEYKELAKSNPFHYFKSIWLTFEVFNVLQINNTISYIWLKDVTNRQYAIPNYLTPRQFNLRLVAKF